MSLDYKEFIDYSSHIWPCFAGLEVLQRVGCRFIEFSQLPSVSLLHFCRGRQKVLWYHYFWEATMTVDGLQGRDV